MKHLFALLTGCSTLFAVPASAQQVVELPSLGAMIEQSTRGGTIQQAEEAVRSRPPETVLPVKTSSGRNKVEEPQAIPVSNQAEAEAAAVKRQREDAKKLEQQQNEFLKRLEKLAKQNQKKYKPLKKVKFLPPNAKNY